MDFAIYSVSLVVGYVITRDLTERMNIHIRLKGVWLHHWILASMLMLALLYLEISAPWVWGALTGVALEGLSRKNWSIKDKKPK